MDGLGEGLRPYFVLDHRPTDHLLLPAGVACAQDKRYVIIDQDAAGPGGTDMMSILVLLQSPTVDVSVTDADSRAPLPCRITITDAAGALTALALRRSRTE